MIKRIDFDGMAYEAVLRRAHGKQKSTDDVNEPNGKELPGLQFHEMRTGKPLLGVDVVALRKEFAVELGVAISLLLSKELEPLETVILEDCLERLKDANCAADLGYIANSAELATRKFKNRTS